MSKCIKCGKSTLIKGHVKLADADICTFCFKKLGFSISDALAAKTCTYDEIKDGKEIMIKKLEIKRQELKAAAAAFEIRNYGQERERNATENELAIFEILCSLTGADDLELVRKSDDYVTAVIGEWDFARFKYTNRAKWINFPCVDLGNVKRRIDSPEDVNTFAEEAKKSLAAIRSYNG